MVYILMYVKDVIMYILMNTNIVNPVCDVIRDVQYKRG